MTLLSQCDFLAVVSEEEMDDEATSFNGNLSSLVLQGYWAVQVGLLTPMTFAHHHLSPLAAFTSSVYFFHNWRRWQWICKFYTANFKTFLEAHSQNVSGNKQ